MHLSWRLIVVPLMLIGLSERHVLICHPLDVEFQHRSSATKQHDFQVIASLTNSAYAKYDSDRGQSRALFAEAADKFEAYIRRYETDPARLSYLIVLVRLGASYQNAGRLEQATTAFEQCERHPQFNSPSATLTVGDRNEVESVANYVKTQLYFLTNGSKPQYKEAYEVTRIHTSSRGSELAPPFSLLNRRPRPANGKKNGRL